jgi:hypothetical protein
MSAAAAGDEATGEVELSDAHAAMKAATPATKRSLSGICLNRLCMVSLSKVELRAVAARTMVSR